MTCIEYFFSLQGVADFLGHPLTIAIIIFLLGRFLINDLIQGSKEKLIEKVVQMKNYLKEAELVYNRIVMTGKDIQNSIKNGDDVKDRQEIFDRTVTQEISRISELVNELIPLISAKIDTDVEIYFKGEELISAHHEYNEAFYKIQKFMVVELPQHKGTFQEKLNDLEGFSFEQMKSTEKKFIKAISKTKTLRLKKR